jgi:hypothetical protein
MSSERIFPRTGAICLVGGGIAVFVFRAAHGDLPAADPAAALAFIAASPFYAAIHLGALLGVVVWAGGLVALANALPERIAGVLGLLGQASALIGAAVYVADFSIDGYAGRALAVRWTTASPAGRADIEQAAGTVFTVLGGTSLTSIAILWGLAPLLIGLAVARVGYPSWLTWSGVIVGAVTFLGACGQFLQPDLVPGVWIYGGLVSLVQIWSVALGLAMWRRVDTTPTGAEPVH